MLLTLEVISPNGAALGANRRKVVGSEGARIGRSRDNDWVINDKYVSGEHARIQYVNGAFYIEGIGRNELAINSPQSFVPNHEPRLLHAGDTVYIEKYEVKVSLGSSPRVADDPFGVLPAGGGGRTEPRIPDALDFGIRDAAVEGGDAALDPLAALGGVEKKQPELPPLNVHQASPLTNSFQPPEPKHATPASKVIPDQWNESQLRLAEPPPRPSPGRAPVRNLTPNVPPPTMTAPPKPQPVVRDFEPEATSSATSLDELLRAAGLPNARMSPEIARELGEVLHIVVQGVMKILQARSEIKYQLRMPLTRVQVSENNPLKFSPNVEAALHTLLVERNRAYLPTARAFEDAFADIRNHQLAILEGMRLAFTEMLTQFDPETLQDSLEGGKRGGLLNIGAKGKLWEQYTEYFQKLASDPDESFRRLFVERFAKAYEQQLERLKTLDRNLHA